MSLDAWLLFCATETVLCFTPGPAVLLVVSMSLSRGVRAGLASSFGILGANAMYFLLSATSLGAILLASWQLFTVVKWLGAAYLIWLGARMLLSASSGGTKQEGSAPALPVHSPRRSFSLGFLTQGANPKALVFFTAILPQFIDTNSPIGFQVFVLGVTSVVIELMVLSLYAATCHTARAWANRPSATLWLRRAGGMLLVGAGARLAAIRRG
jgi:threonine/homoserine/homoserine lactone efflux protein